MGSQIFRLRRDLNKQFKMNGGRPCELVTETKQI